MYEHEKFIGRSAVKPIKACLLVLLISVTPSILFAKDWSKPSNGTTAKVDGSVNLFVSDDVMKLFNSASPQEKIKHCGAKSDFAYKEIEKLSLKPPMRIFGYNSRMDNEKKIEGAEQAKLYGLFLSDAITDS
jgi:hypothetical protein